jgi:hypothetical protein
MEPITKSWIVDAILCVPKDGTDDCEVKGVAWKIVGTDIQNRSIVGGYGTIPVPVTSDSPYTPYNQLTKDKVTTWIKQYLGEQQVKFVEDNVDKEFAALIKPDTVIKSVPWPVLSPNTF